MQLSSALVLLATSVLVAGQDLVASLDYGTFQGAYSSTYNISYWRKIPYAAPPVGENRWRAPQAPLPITNGTYDSSQSFDMCVQRTVNGSEDCLYLGLYSRPWTRPQPLRPVIIVFHGGGFIQGGGSFTLPPSAYPILNVSSQNNLLFIYPNYRLNAFGLLPGKEIAKDRNSDLNVGLLDQQAVLRWTKRYIEKFGGDPSDVTVWGQSAGGGSVVAQVIANGGRTSPPLFKKALASSPFWPKTYRYDAPEAQSIYDKLANLTGCAGKESLKCLKALDAQTIRDANLIIAASHTYNTSSYTWAPVIDGSFLTQELSEATRKGEVNGEAGWGMYNTHEGENFIPPGLNSAANTGTPPFNNTLASFTGWLHGFLPGLSTREISKVMTLYPQAGGTEAITSYNSTYTRSGLIYRDVVLACPSYWLAKAYGMKGKGYVGEYSMSPAKHASDTVWWNQVNAIQKSSPDTYLGYTGAFASFFATGDPNKHKLTNSSVAGVPEVEVGMEFVIKDGSPTFENLSIEGRGGLAEKCEFWRSAGGDIPV
ncbi:putative carboxylesterase [Tricladium varicosporioides]|nr:putative carboxylesterase [Hymenoscyphus varicosporioides]